MTLDNVIDDCVELSDFAFVDEVCLIESRNFSIRWNGNDTESVGIHEFSRLGRGGTGHTGKLVVHAEVVLQGDRCEGLILLFDLDALFCLDCLVDTFRPTATLENSTGELVNDLYVSALDDVILVAAVQLFRLQRHRELVDEVCLHVVVEVLDSEGLLDLFDAGLERNNNSLVFFNLVINVTGEGPYNRRESVIQLCGIAHSSRNNQWGSGLVDKDGVDLVNNAKRVTALHFVTQSTRHVVAQVVETKFVIRSVGDIAAVTGALFI